MTRGILIEAMGVPVALDAVGATDAEAAAVADAWRDARARERGAASPGLVVPIRPSRGAATLAQLLDGLSQRVTRAVLTVRRGELWMLHAAGLALPDGRVIVLVGPSGRGKTTAALRLGRRYGYVSDETVAIAPDGAVHAYRKPLSLVVGPGAPKAQRSPGELGLVPLPDVPLRLGAVVLLDRDGAVESPTVDAVDLGDALDDLVAQTSYLSDLDRPLQTIARLVAATGGVRRLRYREADDLDDAIGRIADGAGAAPVRWRVEAAGSPGASDGTGRDGHVRTPVADAVALADPDRIAVLRRDAAGGGHVSLMAGIAPTLWRAAEGAPSADLVRTAIAVHGDPGGGAAAARVHAALAELAHAGLVEECVREWRIGDAVAWHVSDERRVVLVPLSDRPDVRALEGSAARVWRALAEPGSTEVVVGRVARDVGADPDAVRADVVAFLEKLAADGLVAVIPAAPRGGGAADVVSRS